MGHLVPCRIAFLECFSVIVTFCLSKVAMHPASHNFGIDVRDVPCNAGNKWLSRASMGSSGVFSLAVCVDCIVLLSGE